jgi:WD40 repeat protein
MVVLFLSPSLRSLSAAPDTAPIDQLIEQLGSDDPAKRQEADKQLRERGKPAEEALRKAARTHVDPDVRLRAFVLLRALSDADWGEVRAITSEPSGYWLNRVVFTPDGKQALATGGAVIRYDLAQGKEIQRILELQFARLGLALSRDGKHVLTGHTQDNVVRLVEVETGKEIKTFEGHAAGVNGVALSPDGAQAISAGNDKTLRLWDVKTGKEVRQFKGISDKVFCVAFSPDGKRLLSGHAGEKSTHLVRLWDVSDDKEVRHFQGHEKDVTGVAFLPDGRSFVSTSLDGTIRLWDVETGKELRRMQHEGGAYDVAVDGTGRRALTAGYGDHTVRLWDLTNGTELHRFAGHTTRVLGVAFSPDGKQALSSDANCTLRLWRLSK